MTEQTAPATVMIDREAYYNEHKWDGAKMFGELFGGDAWHTIPPERLRELKVARMIDQLAWLAEVSLDQRHALLQQAAITEPEGVITLLMTQLSMVENRMMTIKLQMHKQAAANGQLMRPVSAAAAAQGNGGDSTCAIC